MTDDQTPQAGGTPLTPPPVTQPQPPTPQPPAPQPPAPQPHQAATAAPSATSNGGTPGSRPILIITAILGGVALLGTGGTAAVAAVGDLSRVDSAQSIDVDGIEGIDLDVSASDMTVVFDDVDEAELVVRSGRGGAWTLERDEDELIVRSPDRVFGWWFGNWFDDEESVTLTLPERLLDAGIDGDISLNAGSLDIAGEFGELDVQVGAGALSLEGSATTLDAQVSAGRAEIELDGVRTADLGVSAGRLIAEFTGSAPDTIVAEVSAGSLELTVPDEEYDVRDDVSAGSLDNRLDTSARASRTIDVSVSAGSVTLRPGD